MSSQQVNPVLSIIPVGSILLYGSLSRLSMTPWSDIQHVGILLQDRSVIHMTYRGVKIHPIDELQVKFKNKYTLRGYLQINLPSLVSIVLSICEKLKSHPQSLQYINWSCPTKLVSLLNPIVPCLSNTKVSQQRSFDVIRRFGTMIRQDSRGQNRQQKFVTVCSTLVFMILGLALSRQKSTSNMLEHINVESCQPSNVKDLAKTFPNIFTYHDLS